MSVLRHRRCARISTAIIAKITSSCLPDGSLHLFTNASPDQRWSTVRITGIKNIKLAPGATVEMKSGIFYDKRIYAGVPIAVCFGRTCGLRIRFASPGRTA